MFSVAIISNWQFKRRLASSPLHLLVLGTPVERWALFEQRNCFNEGDDFTTRCGGITITLSVLCPYLHFLYLKDTLIILQIEVETDDRNGTLLGSLSESKTNISYVLLEAGFANFSSFVLGRIPDAHVFTKAEQSAKQKKLKVTPPS